MVRVTFTLKTCYQNKATVVKASGSRNIKTVLLPYFSLICHMVGRFPYWTLMNTLISIMHPLYDVVKCFCFIQLKMLHLNNNYNFIFIVSFWKQPRTVKQP